MKYWLAIGGESVGPHTVEEIRELLRKHHVTRDTPAMPEDGDEWTALGTLPEFAAANRPMPSLQRHTALGGPRTARALPTAGPATRPVMVSTPSSAKPVIIILVVIAVFAAGGGIFVQQHSAKLKRETEAAEAKAAEQKAAAEAAAKAAAERAANPAMALEGASRDQIIAALKKQAEAVVTEGPFTVNLSTTPTDDTHLAMVKGLTGLEVLHVGGGKVTDAGLSALAGLSQLRELSIGAVVGAGGDVTAAPSAEARGITDAGLGKIKDLKTVRRLHLWNCSITDAGLEVLDEMRGLYDLELVNTSVTEAAARRFIEEHPAMTVTVRSPGFTIEP